jgi:hypothetical protein
MGAKEEWSLASLYPENERTMVGCRSIVAGLSAASAAN